MYRIILRTPRWVVISLLFAIFIRHATSIAYAQKIPSPLKPVDENRVTEIEKLLPDKPAGFGDPCTERETWDKLLKGGKYDQFLKEMEGYSFPAFSKADYFSLSDGSAPSSAKGLQMMRDRAKGLSQVTWAECLENKGKYIKLLEDGLRDIIDQKSWVSPRNDFDFKNYNGIEYSVELTSALYAHTIAQTLYLLGEKLNPALRKDAIEAVRKRVFDPVLKKIKTQNDARENKFLEMTNNYNHVCLSGVVGAALTILESKKERALFTYIGECYSKNGLEGFGDDGYCSEGVGYYNYGFGHYIILRENILQATRGKLDLFSIDKVKRIATFVPRLEIINGVFPAISDSKEGVKPDPTIMNYLSRNFGLGLAEFDNLKFEGKTDDNRNQVMMVFPNSASKVAPGKNQQNRDEGLRSFFEGTGVLISRPAQGSSLNVGVAFKGGNNKEHHNHNDVGSYTVVMGNEIMAGDPGAIPYTADIFTDKFRYKYKSIGSFGHPVPLIAGKEQIPGAEARAKTISSNFTNDKDELVLDITSAYPVEDLKKVLRDMQYSRSAKGGVSITDNFEFSKPEVFETAIITRAKWEQKSDSTLLLAKGKEKMLVTFRSEGNKLSLRSEEITEGGTPYFRIGIFTEKPVQAGQIMVRYEPVN